MYVYLESERFTDEKYVTHVLYTVGFYSPDGKFHPESDHASADEAAERVHYLNGGNVKEYNFQDPKYNPYLLNE